jgi:SAM-dependent methyltransferase
MDYPYDSSMTKTGQLHWAELASTSRRFFSGQNDLSSLDIGANVGSLVKEFENLGFNAFGVDPSDTATKIANSNELQVENAFFDFSFAKEWSKTGKLFDIITATNVFAHIDDLDDWLNGILLILKNKGILIIEVPHVLNLILQNQFDTIYHEHLSYVSIKPLLSYFKKFGLEIFKIEERTIHGGTIRIYVGRLDDYEIENSVQEIIIKEHECGVDDSKSLQEFEKRVFETVLTFQDFIQKNRAQGKSIVAVSAPAKGMTFLNVVGLQSPNLAAISDAATQKIGKYAPGTGVRVISDEDLAILKPDIVIVLAWNFAEEIINKIKSKFGEETSFITAIPRLKEFKNA